MHRMTCPICLARMLGERRMWLNKTSIKNGVWFTALLLVLTIATGTALAQTELTPQEAKNLIDTNPDLIVVDVREESEFCSTVGHIPCALNYPWNSGVLQQRYTELPSEVDILVVCRRGNRSLLAAEFLVSQGYTSVYHMIGGMNQWEWETLSCATPCLNNPEGGGYLVTDDLWIRGVIDSEEKGPIDAVWQMGGDATTSADDRVIWGHFYASPSDVTWGKESNPDLFVKIWFDHGGRLDVNFFHVSVPEIEVYSDYTYDGTTDQQGITSMTTRYIRQYYENDRSSSSEQEEDGEPAAGFSPSGDPSGFTTINDLRIGTLINTEENGAIEAVWRLGAQDTTDRGDQVIWGFFHADSEDVTWGSGDNPDLFVKIWFDVSGRIDVNFFHVSVPDIEVYSDYPQDGTYDQKGTCILADRYIRHEYTRQSPPPTATITSPSTGETYNEGGAIFFSGLGYDPEDGSLTGTDLVWTSSIDGQIGTGDTLSTSDLSVGIHTITLTCTDSGGATGSASVSITVSAVSYPATYTNSLGMSFVLISPGTFMMGSPEDELGRNPDETLHQVTISKPYYLQTTEVTQEQWEAVVGSNGSWWFGCDDCPVEEVSWPDAEEFINELNDMGIGTYRLPTEAEWEYGARAGTTTAFANGGIIETGCEYEPNLDQMGWYCYNTGRTEKVAQKLPNVWGLYDMHGNVYEWCQDWYGEYPSAPVTDPQGPDSGNYRVLRGGSWYGAAWHARSAKRLWINPRIVGNTSGGFDEFVDVGLRVAMDSVPREIEIRPVRSIR